MTIEWIDRPRADYWDLDTIDLGTEFDVLIASLTAEQVPEPEQRIVVLVELPQADEPTMVELTYGCRFGVQPGDRVVRLGDNGYTGRVKYVDDPDLPLRPAGHRGAIEPAAGVSA